MTTSAARPASSLRTRTAATTIQGRFAPQAHPFLSQDGTVERVLAITCTVAARRGVRLSEHDLEDCAQSAWERLVPAFRRFDPRRGNADCLLTRTVTNATKSWLTARIAQKRDVRRQVPMPLCRTTPEATANAADTDRDDDDACWRTLCARRNDQQQLATDLWRVVAELPDDLRTFILTLAAEHRHHARTRRALGLTEPQYEALRARACRILTDADLAGLP